MSKSFPKDKGARFERQVIQILRPVVTECYEAAGLEPPKMQRNSLQSDGGGFDLVGLNWIAIECKHQENLNTNVWWLQCLGQAKSGQVPVLLYKQNNVKIKVMMHGILITTGASNIRCPVEVSMESFLLYFKHRLIEEIKKEMI
jgi:hypothetical protein